jgi:superfamily II DNA helicase RecQ
MSYKFFQVPCRNPESFEAGLNSFLSTHRIVTVDRKFVEDGADSFWVFCVDFLHGDAKGGTSHGAPGRAERRIDYREVLSAEQFEVFAKLREVRKSVAEREAVPVYAVFTNEQLATMVQNNADNRSKLREIEGIGEAKLDKYAELFLSVLRKAPETS